MDMKNSNVVDFHRQRKIPHESSNCYQCRGNRSPLTHREWLKTQNSIFPIYLDNIERKKLEAGLKAGLETLLWIERVHGYGIQRKNGLQGFVSQEFDWVPVLSVLLGEQKSARV